jgi:peptidyl-prolyl cis-trans isomerase A (cyclophilin A)
LSPPTPEPTSTICFAPNTNQQLGKNRYTQKTNLIQPDQIDGLKLAHLTHTCIVAILMNQATLHTSMGDIVIELFPNHAPKTVQNFVDLATGAKEWVDPNIGEKVKTKLYDGIIFHRVIPNFMIQGGDPLGSGMGGPGYNFADEFHGELSFDKPYLLAMANAGPNTNGSQFFITVAPTTWLNRKHSIFGEVKDVASQKVVDAIATVKTGKNDKPVQAVKINSVSFK